MTEGNLARSKSRTQPLLGSDSPPTPTNSTLFQAFEWHAPQDGQHWNRLRDALPGLKALGIDRIWLPPGCKGGSGPYGNGYDLYDLYDLGEFEQKGSRRTKWGPKEDLMQLAAKAKEEGVGLYWDAVLNHRSGADRTERVRVVEVDQNDRNKEISKPYEIDAWLGFDFPGRGDTYSAQKYHSEHFSGTDWDDAAHKKAIYRLHDKAWSRFVDTEHGNADFLMGADVDYAHPAVVADAKHWGTWIVRELNLTGFRLDAVRHIDARFTHAWVEQVRAACREDLFVVGEYWSGEARRLAWWIRAMGRCMALFDVPLLHNFARASAAAERADLRRVFAGSLVGLEPAHAVTFVANHDTQPGQTVATPIAPFFQPLAYSLILLRRGGHPCVFYGDLYGIRGADPLPPACSGLLPTLILARTLYAYGAQHDHFDDPRCVGWVRQGTWDRPDGLACVMSSGAAAGGRKRMGVGREHAGEVWTDLLGWANGEVRIDEKGEGVFWCGARSVSVWVNRDAPGRSRFPPDFDVDIYKGR